MYYKVEGDVVIDKVVDWKTFLDNKRIKDHPSSEELVNTKRQHLFLVFCPLEGISRWRCDLGSKMT